MKNISTGFLHHSPDAQKVKFTNQRSYRTFPLFRKFSMTPSLSALSKTDQILPEVHLQSSSQLNRQKTSICYRSLKNATKIKSIHNKNQDDMKAKISLKKKLFDQKDKVEYGKALRDIKGIIEDTQELK